MIKEVTYKSKDNITDIHAVMWIPKKKVKAIVQVAHGMIEHILRYDNFAKVLNKEGILVVGNDHLGHGTSVIDKKNYGYFAKKDAYNIVIEDIHTLNEKVRNEYKGVPIFLLGHSMGSFIVRNYITKYGESLDGAIIVGTGNQSKIIMHSAKIINKIIICLKGEYHRSRFIANQTIDGYYKYFDKDNKISWLCTNPDTISSYMEDPKTYFKFTCNGYETLFNLILNAKRSQNLIPKHLPILILSGKNDPVGNFGSDIEKLYNEYKKLGIKNVDYKLYDNMRHEILNELNCEVVYKDLLDFINIKKDE